MIIPEILRERIPGVRSVCVLTGAGISAESGVPTFRGNDGLWKKFRPEELANVQAFMRNPELVWEWYAYRRRLIAEVKPHAGHRALVEIERRVSDFTLVTQNVDGLHADAGSRHILELHGNIRRNICLSCSAEAPQDLPVSDSHVPTCPSCGGLIRPGVVWFGEMLPMMVFAEAERAAKRCDLFLSIGTSTVVYPAASLAFTAKTHGAFVAEINPESTDLTPHADVVLRTPASVGVPAIAELFIQSLEPV